MTVPNPRTSSSPESSAPAAGPAALSGEELLQAVVDGRIAPPAISTTLGFSLTAVRPGHATAAGETDPGLGNINGTVHGGYLATLLDSVLGASVLTLLPPGAGISTVQLNVNFVRPVPVGLGMLHCSAQVVHLGRTLATAQAQLVGMDGGRLYAHATAGIAVIPAGPDLPTGR
ncbi:PaaI family thioesterase [Kitasatospora sp. NPDC088346]|uniref:PaaI family thioesterase n=1 Tax=Kitasatospora sp. NPDC088346 TaxID=3364073 RepID=UPI00381EEBC6